MNIYNHQQTPSTASKNNQLMPPKASDNKIRYFYNSADRTTYVPTYLNPSKMQYNGSQTFKHLADYINVEIPSKINNLNLQIGNYKKTLKLLEVKVTKSNINREFSIVDRNPHKLVEESETYKHDQVLKQIIKNFKLIDDLTNKINECNTSKLELEDKIKNVSHVIEKIIYFTKFLNILSTSKKLYLESNKNIVESIKNVINNILETIKIPNIDTNILCKEMILLATPRYSITEPVFVSGMFPQKPIEVPNNSLYNNAISQLTNIPNYKDYKESNFYKNVPSTSQIKKLCEKFDSDSKTVISLIGDQVFVLDNLGYLVTRSTDLTKYFKK
ncbi:MAG: hypothetical protein LW807_02105 [Proteobacteria bacterium]|jgi:hypothetical protein|nr:hypothetical protein [Pseudomonadota bacterium]